MTTPKSPEQILEGFKDLIHLYENYQLVNDKEPKLPDEAWLRSSMASLLCYMAEKMPEWRQEVDNSSDKQTCDLCGSQSYIEGRNSALDNCRTLLIEEARKITEV